MLQYDDMNKRQNISQKMRANSLEGTRGYRSAFQLASAVALYLFRLLNTATSSARNQHYQAQLPSCYQCLFSEPSDADDIVPLRTQLRRGCFINSSRRQTYRGGDMPRALLEPGVLVSEKTTLPIDIR